MVRHTGGLDQTVIGSVGSQWAFGLGSDKSAYWKIGANLLTNAPVADNQWHILSGVVEKFGSIKLWRDGFLIHQGDTPRTPDYKPRFLALGGAQANEDFSKSEIAEVLLL